MPEIMHILKWIGIHYRSLTTKWRWYWFLLQYGWMTSTFAKWPWDVKMVLELLIDTPKMRREDSRGAICESSNGNRMRFVLLIELHWGSSPLTKV